MKIKSKYLIFLIIICILFSISTVSASEMQADAISMDNTYQSDIGLEDTNPEDMSEISDDVDFELNAEYGNEELNSANDEEPSDVNTNEELNSANTQEVYGEDAGTLNDFYDDVMNCGGTLNLERDYIYNTGDSGDSTSFAVENLTINGNNHIIDGGNDNYGIRFFHPEGKEPVMSNIILNDLTLKNFNGAALTYGEFNVTLNNVKIINGTDKGISSIYVSEDSELHFNNSKIQTDSSANLLYGTKCKIVISNSSFSGAGSQEPGIFMNRGQLIVENCTFENFNAQHGSIINYKGDHFTLKDSKFLNSNANLTGGAIIAKYFPITKKIGDKDEFVPSDAMLIENCLFSNLSSLTNGGAILIDLDSGSEHVHQNLNIIGSNFTDCKSKMGGAIVILGGGLNISDSNFKNNNASLEGGAIYSSWTNVNIGNSNFENNIAGRNAGALFFDKGKLIVNDTSFIQNKALKESNSTANAIYAYDVDAYLANSTFNNGGIAVYADFASNSKIEDVEKNDDIFLMDNHNYIVSVESKGMKLNLSGSEIIVDTLPSKFDARDWGWVTPGKVQGDNDDCWAFATAASIETALLKATGSTYNISQNYIQHLQLKYYPLGDKRICLTGFAYSGLGYALSWYGPLPIDGPYDDRGMVASEDFDVPRIHLQDALIIPGSSDNIEKLIKQAILKYGAVSVQLILKDEHGEIYDEGDDISIMDHNIHFVSIIGWDDDYVDESEHTRGTWITKDSLNEFDKISYNDTELLGIDYYAIVPQNPVIAYIFENDIDYHVNYQTDLTGLTGFDANYTIYSNEFTSKYDELIGAVGTYFNESGINYSFDIFVNDQKVHSQTGTSEFGGFRTIILNKYIPIKTGEKFKVVFKSNSVPYQAWSRVHYLNGTSLVSNDGTSWIDFAPLDKTVCLKVYTVEDDTKIIGNKNIAVDYDGGSYYSVKVVTADGRSVGAGETVKFTINGKTTTVKTDNNGMAKIKISQLPGKYTITTSYRGKTYKNTVTVKQVLKATKVSVKNTAKKLVLKATLKINGKAVKGKTIKFKFKGKTYKAKTNKKGIAKVTIKQKVIKKLTKKSYAVKVTYLKDTVKTTVKVKQVLKAYKASVKKSAKKFKLKASLKINGKAAKKKLIKFTFKGKTYKAKTNKKGIAKVTVKKAVINKLKKGKTYKAKVAYKKDYVKTTVKVKR